MSTTLQKPKPGLATAIGLPFVIWVVLAVAGSVLLVMGFVRAGDVFDDLARLEPGTPETVELTSSGGYRIWLERPGVDDELGVSATATVTGPDDQDIPVETYDGSLEFSDGGDAAVAVLTFDAPEAGTYTIEANETAFGSEQVATDARFAVGKGNPLAEVGKGFAFFFGLGTLGFLIALVLLIVLLVRRGRSKRRITQASAGSGYGGPGGYGGSGGYPPPGGSGGYPPPGGPGGYPSPGGDPPPGASWSQ